MTFKDVLNVRHYHFLIPSEQRETQKLVIYYSQVNYNDEAT